MAAESRVSPDWRNQIEATFGEISDLMELPAKSSARSGFEQVSDAARRSEAEPHC